MARFLQWGAVVTLLSLMSLQSEALDGISPAPLDVDHVFNTYTTDGERLTREQFTEVVTQEMDNYIQDINYELLEELMNFGDENNDGTLDREEYEHLANYIIKNNM